MILRSIFSCTDLLDHNSKYDNSAGNDVLHNAWHLHEDKGIVVEVNNGSSLFSGDAASGESNIRKYHHFAQNFVAKTVHFTVFVFLAPIWEKRYNLRDRKLSIAA